MKYLGQCSYGIGNQIRDAADSRVILSNRPAGREKAKRDCVSRDNQPLSQHVSGLHKNARPARCPKKLPFGRA